MENKTLALFDFDGTLTTKDSFLELIKYHKGKWKFFFGMFRMIPHIALYKSGIINAQKLKEKLISYFWKEMPVNEFNAICIDFNQAILPELLRKKGIEQLEKHIADGDDVAIVSASAQNWLQPFCDNYQIHCIASILELKNEKLTGKLTGKNCKGGEKICRVKKFFNLNDYKNIIVYGDSSGDKPLMKIASTAYYKPFRD